MHDIFVHTERKHGSRSSYSPSHKPDPFRKFHQIVNHAGRLSSCLPVVVFCDFLHHFIERPSLPASYTPRRLSSMIQASSRRLAWPPPAMGDL